MSQIDSRLAKGGKTLPNSYCAVHRSAQEPGEGGEGCCGPGHARSPDEASAAAGSASGRCLPSVGS